MLRARFCQLFFWNLAALSVETLLIVEQVDFLLLELQHVEQESEDDEDELEDDEELELEEMSDLAGELDRDLELPLEPDLDLVRDLDRFDSFSESEDAELLQESLLVLDCASSVGGGGSGRGFLGGRPRGRFTTAGAGLFFALPLPRPFAFPSFVLA